jgi:hypothetical protein
MSGTRIGHDLRMKIAQIYADMDRQIMRELGKVFGPDDVLDTLLDLMRMRLEVFEKIIDEDKREKPPSGREALN